MQHFFYIFVHVLLGQEYKREDEVPNEGDVIVWTPEPQSAHLSAVLLPVECPNHQVLCQSGQNKLLCTVQSPRVQCQSDQGKQLPLQCIMNILLINQIASPTK